MGMDRSHGRNTAQQHTPSARREQTAEGGSPRVRRPAAGTHAEPSARPSAPARQSANAHAPAPVRQTPGQPEASARASRTPFGIPLGPEWVLAPLRLFLGVTFVYAGIQKLADPQFFKPSAPRYIGHQIQGFAHGSPISWLLLHVALPHASFFGGLIAYGEIAIGLGALVGLLARPAAVFGGLLSLTFFLSATWKVYPYFYGADIVFVFAWVALGLAPHAGLPSLDEEIARRLAGRWSGAPGWRERVVAWALSVTAGWTSEPAWHMASPAGARSTGAGRASTRQSGRGAYRQQLQEQSRRSFLVGVASGVIGVAGITWLWNAFHPASTGSPSSTGGQPGSSSGSGTPGTSASGSGVVAKASDVPADSATAFTLSNGDPGVVVHLSDGRFVAYDAACTHAGCTVQYDSGSKDLYCPCHGAVFDPAKQAAVLQGPTSTPLTPVPVSVNSNGEIVVNA